MIALVTGGSGGLGQGICRALAEQGMAVGIGYHVRREVAERLAEELRSSGQRAMALALEVRDAAAMDAAVEQMGAQWDGLDILVNAAAYNVDGLLATLTPEDVEHMHAVNIAGTMNTIRSALPFLIASGRGRIVNFSSVLAVRGLPGISAYAATKGAIESLTRSLAVELGPKRITVNALAPGFIDAGLGKKPVEAAGYELANWVPLRRAGRAEEVAAVVAFLVSEAASYVSGAVIPVDGGTLAGSRFLSAPAPTPPEEVKLT